MSTYLTIRNKIKSGDLLAWGHDGWGSWYDIQVQMVRVFTQSEYAHVAIAWKVGGRVFALEAVSTGVRIFPLSRLLPFYWIPLKLAWTSEVEKTALKKIGEKYSKLQAIRAYFNELAVGKDDSWQCAEYVKYVYEIAGLETRCKATPSALVDELLDMGLQMRKIND